MSFFEHLAELRRRAITAALALLVGFGICYTFAEKIFKVLSAPYDDAYRSALHREPMLITTGLIESFMVYLKVGLVGGLFLGSPVVFYQLWKFVAPAMPVKVRGYVWLVVILATAFFVGGAMFGYFGAFPVGFKYFLSLTPDSYIQPQIRMDEYFQMAAWMLIVFGLVFEAPLIVLVLVFLKVITTRHLLVHWRGIIIGIAIAAAILTPADTGSMIMMVVPLLLLYVMTIIVSALIDFSRRA